MMERRLAHCLVVIGTILSASSTGSGRKIGAQFVKPLQVLISTNGWLANTSSEASYLHFSNLFSL
ncbi:hypothetical protein KSP40_PGU010033 [Platanthera guangdongensis]|uniref:Secreted protein n=1 Tax=Platanthera guangdongensis TaxID=2320717 RepID=A0ABR2LWI5_9ASPA